MKRIEIAIACPGKERPRWGQGVTYTPKKTKAYEFRISGEYRLANGPYIEGPVRLFIEAFYKPPESWSKKKAAAAIGQWKQTKPDIDNVVKLVKDALNGVAYADDAQVTDLGVSKSYAERDLLVITIGPAS